MFWKSAAAGAASACTPLGNTAAASPASPSRPEQFDEATRRVKEAGLDHLIEIRFQDYRLITGQFDKIASIEMLEAVGEKYLETYFAKCAEVLAPHGILAVQMITVADHNYRTLAKGTDWIQKHIFPGSLLLAWAA
jgi:cyclopropane-fatty-acyl-phospholipid synthase